ncbi:MAG TPA: hypothetical protein VH724_04305 [Candidatus Angelobacter sp.]|nr:hypothetical protein [Candidatus Angelobacter sp.]
MKRWKKALALLCLCWSIRGLAENNQRAEPTWKVDIREKFEFQAFDRTINFRWTLHQGVLFLTPERILIYQVNRSRGPAKLAARDASGGSGNFFIDIRVLNSHDGSEIKSFQLPTNADFSKIMATRGGKFIVRTGDILYLYSENFQRLASRALPLKRQVSEEGWQIGVSPSGEEVMLVHQQIFKRNALSSTSNVERAEADVEVLNADTLQLAKTFSLQAFLAAWFAADHSLLSSSPAAAAPAATFGVLDFTGEWSPLVPDWLSAKQPCAYQSAALEHQLFAAFGCGNLSVFPRNGAKVFSLKTGSKEFVGSVQGSQDYLAVQLERRFLSHDSSGNIPIAMAQPLRIDLYELKGSKPLISVGLHSNNIYYAVSSRGSVTVVDGTALEFFALPKR